MATEHQPPSPAGPSPAGRPVGDPVRVRRAIVARWTRIASRIGYLLFGVAIAMFFFALLTDFTAGKVGIVTTAMIAGSVLLAPAIVLGYAVKAAEKDDVARGI